MTVEEIIGRLDQRDLHPKQTGAGKWQACCPAHDDRVPSLCVGTGNDDRVLVHCQAGCETLDVLASLDLTAADLFAQNGNGHPGPLEEYLYTDEHDAVRFKVVRKPGKQFPQARPDGSGGWIWNLQGVDRVLYRLPKVLAAVAAGETIYVAEGEKDVHALEHAGVAATTNPGGAGKWRDAYSRPLAGAEVTIIADRDEAGRAHADTVAESLRKQKCHVRILEAAKGKDAHDHLAAGLAVEHFKQVPDAGPDEHADEVRELQVVAMEDFAAVEEPGADALVGSGDAALVPEGGDVMVYGDGGAGKTTLTFDLGCHLGAGNSWLGVRVSRAVRVLVIENEGPRALFRAKVKRKLAGWTGSPLEGRVSILERPWGEITFADPSWQSTLAAKIRDHEIDVLIAGPVTRLGMDEAGTLQQVRDFMELVKVVRVESGRRLTVILVHHENKGGAVSGAWEGSGDTLLHVEERGQGHTHLHIQKARWSSEHHNTNMDLAWTDGEGFTVEDARDYVAEMKTLLADGRWRTAKEIATPRDKPDPGIGAGVDTVKDVLKENRGIFNERTGDDAKEVGRSSNATVYGLTLAQKSDESDSDFQEGGNGSDSLTSPLGESEVEVTPSGLTPQRKSDRVGGRTVDELEGIAREHGDVG